MRGHLVIRFDDVWVKFRSRLMRMRNLALGVPFDVTLAVDDDTVFCPTDDLEVRLRALATRTVRFVPSPWPRARATKAPWRKRVGSGRAGLRQRNVGGRRRRVPVAGDARARAGCRGGAATKARAGEMTSSTRGSAATCTTTRRNSNRPPGAHDNALGADQPPLREVAEGALPRLERDVDHRRAVRSPITTCASYIR